MKALPNILQGPSSLVMPLAGGSDDQDKAKKDKDKLLAGLPTGGAASPLINSRRGGGLLTSFLGSGS